jgi:hypothetical protein
VVDVHKLCGFLSIATGANDDQATVGQTIDIPVGGR